MMAWTSEDCGEVMLGFSGWCASFSCGKDASVVMPFLSTVCRVESVTEIVY